MQMRKNGNYLVTIRLTLVPGRDADLIDMVKSAPSGMLAGMMREAMRHGVTKKIDWLDDIEDEEANPINLSSFGEDL